MGIRKTFAWCSEVDEERNNSCSGIIKNGGKFKSLKHKKFFDKIAMVRSKEEIDEYFGIKVEAEEAKTVDVDAMTSWADYGSRSLVPYKVIYIIDEIGIVAKYRIRYRGNMRDGAAPDPSRTELKWERDKSITSNPDVEQEAEEIAKINEELEYVDAEVGERLSFEIDKVRKAGHYFTQFGETNVWEITSGNKILVWKTGNFIPEDAKVIKGTIKEFSEYNGKKQTVLSRCKIS